MNELRPPSSSYLSYSGGGGGGGRDLDINVDVKTLRTTSGLYGATARSRSRSLHDDYINNNINSYREIVKRSRSSKKSSVLMFPWLSDPETKRRKRVAKYKYYSYEGRVKSSIKDGYRWIRTKCSKLIHGV
ncbi:DUF3511 domain protein [Melia azedarach]|uniref:DUF3511 domain protein n=1 Tax=Melia azedarach TaxID=155640 RepID=A0ACC1Y6P8_MELAZ|nr:DUF3511 domain protein [Melia azedarach]